MKLIGFNVSAREDGNTAILINYVFGELKKLRLMDSFLKTYHSFLKKKLRMAILLFLMMLLVSLL